jgi:hypothetical protein
MSDILVRDEICLQDLLGGRSLNKFAIFVRPSKSLEVMVDLSCTKNFQFVLSEQLDPALLLKLDDKDLSKTVFIMKR